jgi:hypothetical protein
MRPRLALPLLALVVMLPAGCGGKFDLPTEHRNTSVPTDKSYAMLATWKGMVDVQDLLLTQGQGDQLFAVFNHGGSGGPAVARGEVQLYPLTGNLDPNKVPRPIGAPYFNPLTTLFNPIAIASATSSCSCWTGRFVHGEVRRPSRHLRARRGSNARRYFDRHDEIERHPIGISTTSATWRVREVSWAAVTRCPRSPTRRGRSRGASPPTSRAAPWPDGGRARHEPDKRQHPHAQCS